MENYSLLMGDSSVDEDSGGVDGEAFRGHFPVRRRNRDSCPPYLGFAMAAALEGPPDLSTTWTMNFDGSKRLEGAGAGVILISPEGDKLKYVLRMTFPNASNNEAEYEALIHGMKMAKACGATRLKIFGDSQLVAQQVMNQCDAVNDSMVAYKEMYNELEKLFDGCEVNHISRLSIDEADVLANIGSQCLAIPGCLGKR
ncbi:hypothetical protein QYE76_050700 [Lolium multiflorum]|uniref:RNase H type-1 domain-containing protein n=1 Tax=Lolium multiflorum TaxID=4521 RepID=A0AAD8SS42_LOLMU|nr:hypothetical protein QYE76_050700 [Lolium multiflorum]